MIDDTNILPFPGTVAPAVDAEYAEYIAARKAWGFGLKPGERLPGATVVQLREQADRAFKLLCQQMNWNAAGPAKQAASIASTHRYLADLHEHIVALCGPDARTMHESLDESCNEPPDGAA